MHVYDPVFVNVARVLFQYNFNTDCIKETSIGGHVLQLDVLGGRVLGAHCTIVQLYAAKKKSQISSFFMIPANVRYISNYSIARTLVGSQAYRLYQWQLGANTVTYWVGS